MNIPASKSFYYRRAMAQQEKGGKAWRVAVDVVKHENGQVTYRPLIAGTSETTARKIAISYNKKLTNG